MAFHPRGGPPYARQITVSTTGNINGASNDASPEWPLEGPTTWLAVQALDTPIRVYFNLKDFTDNRNYIAVIDSFSAPMEIKSLWFRSTSGTANVQIVAVLKG